MSATTPEPSPARIPVSVFFALFTLSGFAGLIYQSIWSHYLKLFLGHAAYAQTLVLGIFMGGMAIGSWLVSRFTHRIPNLLAGYAGAEIGIGLLAIVFHRVFVGVTGWAFDTAIPAIGDNGVDLFKWALASLLILPASVLLGTTFPLMSAGILRRHPDVGGRALSMLYFTNSFGAALGVLASGFVLIDRIGLPGTILTAGIVNVALGLAVWLLVRGAAPTPAPAVAAAPSAEVGRLQAAVLAMAFATGAASFIYEVTWIRMLSLGLGASTHAFEVMLAAFILAMSLGAFWFRNRIGRLGSDIAWLAGLLVAKAALAAYAVWIYGDVLGFVGWVMTSVARTDGGYSLATFAGLVASMIVMFPTAFCAGMTLPLATHVLTSRGRGEAAIGRVYGANTAGCILGAVLATHLGMEALGVKGLTGLGAALDAAVGGLILAAGLTPARRMRALAVLGAVAVAGLGLFAAADIDLLRMSSGVYRHGVFLNPAIDRVAFYRDGKTATISVIETGTVRTIRTNGKTDAAVQMDTTHPASTDEPTMILAAALPLAMKPDAVDVANIGFGSGLTTHALLGNPGVRTLDSIEIERMMIEGARSFRPRNERAYQDPRSHLHIEDAKTFFASRGARYDIIVSEPSNPWVSGVSTLFSEEFYGQVKRYLKPGGLLVQWVQAYEIDAGLLSSIFQALGRQFGDYVVYRTHADLLVVASVSGPVPPLSPRVFEMPGIAADLRNLGFASVRDLESLRVGGRRALGPFFASTGYPPNSDYFPILDQRAPRARFRNATVSALPEMRDDLAPILALLDGDWRTPLARVHATGLNDPYMVKRATEGAEAIGLFLGAPAEATRSLSREERSAVLLARAQLDDCAASRSDWLDAFTQVARLAVPFLERDAVAVLFERVRASRCFKSQDEAGRRWVGLLQAINARDAATILAEGGYLLQPSVALPDDRRALAVRSVMAAALATGDPARAEAVGDAWVPQLPRREAGSLSMSVLAAQLRRAAPHGAK